METNKKLFFNSQSLRNLLQKDHIHMKGMKTMVPIMEESSLVQSIIQEEVGNQQSLKLLKTLRQKKEKEEKKKFGKNHKPPPQHPSPLSLLMKAVNAMMVHHTIFEYCCQRLSLPKEDITMLEQNFPRIKSLLAPIFYKLTIEYENTKEQELNLFQCIVNAYQVADPEKTILPELEQFLFSEEILQSYHQYYKASRFVDRIFYWIWTRLLVYHLMLLMGQFHGIPSWKLISEEFVQNNYRQLVAKANHRKNENAFDLSSTASSLLLNTYSSNLDLDLSITSHSTAALIPPIPGRPISNPDYSTMNIDRPSSNPQNSVLYSQSTKLLPSSNHLPKILDKKNQAQYGFDESYARSTPRALQSHFHGLKNNYSHPLDPNALSIMSGTSTPMEQIEQLRKELYISQLGIKQLNKVVDENITWVQNNCEVNEKHLYLSQRAKWKCKKLAIHRLINILQRWFLRIQHYSFSKWKLTIKYEQYSTTLRLFHYHKSLLQFRKIFIMIYMKLNCKRWIQWYQMIQRQRQYERSAASIQIQRIIRGFLGKFYYQKCKMTKAAIKIQSLFFILHARKKVQTVKRLRIMNAASRVLQRYFRGIVQIRQAKREVQRRRELKASSKIQALFRGQKVRQEVLPEILKEKEQEEAERLKKQQLEEELKLAEGGGGDLEKVALKASSPRKTKVSVTRNKKGSLAATTASIRVEKQSKAMKGIGLGKASTITTTVRPKKKDSSSSSSSKNVEQTVSVVEQSVSVNEEEKSKELIETAVQSEPVLLYQSPLSSARSNPTPRNPLNNRLPTRVASPGIEIGIQASLDEEFPSTVGPLKAMSPRPPPSGRRPSRQNTPPSTVLSPAKPTQSVDMATSPLTIISDQSSRPLTPVRREITTSSHTNSAAKHRKESHRAQRLSFENNEQHKEKGDQHHHHRTMQSSSNRKGSTNPHSSVSPKKPVATSSSSTAKKGGIGAAASKDPAVQIQKIARGKLARARSKKFVEEKKVDETAIAVPVALNEGEEKVEREEEKKDLFDSEDLTAIEQIASMVQSRLDQANPSTPGSRRSIRGSLKQSFLQSGGGPEASNSSFLPIDFPPSNDEKEAKKPQLSLDPTLMNQNTDGSIQLPVDLLPDAENAIVPPTTSAVTSPKKPDGADESNNTSNQNTPSQSKRSSFRLSFRMTSPLPSFTFLKNPFSTPSAAPSETALGNDGTSTPSRPRSDSRSVRSSRYWLGGGLFGTDSESEQSLRAKTAPVYPSLTPNSREPTIRGIPGAEHDIFPLTIMENDKSEMADSIKGRSPSSKSLRQNSMNITESFPAEEETSLQPLTPNEKAIHRIQLLFRRSIAYRRYLRKKQKVLQLQKQAAMLIEWSVVTIQKTARAKQGRRRFEQIAKQKQMETILRREQSAIKIQCMIRKYFARKRVKKLRKLRDEEIQRMNYIKSLQKKKKEEIQTLVEEPVVMKENDEIIEKEKEKKLNKKKKQKDKESPRAAATATATTTPRQQAQPEPIPATPTPAITKTTPSEKSLTALDLANVPQFQEIDNKIKYLEELEKRLKQSEENVKLEAMKAEERVANQLRLLEERTKQAEAERLAQQELMRLAVGPVSHRSPFMTTGGGHPPAGPPAKSSGTPSPMTTKPGGPMRTGGSMMRSGGPMATGGSKSGAPPVFHYEGNDWIQLWDENNQLYYWWCEKLQLSQWNRPDEEPSVAAEEYETNTESGYESTGALTDYSTDHDVSAYSESEYGDGYQGAADGWQEFWDEQAQAKYWYNNVTGEASWTPPESIENKNQNALTTTNSASNTINPANGWNSYIDEETGHLYWHNLHTGEVRWDY